MPRRPAAARLAAAALLLAVAAAQPPAPPLFLPTDRPENVTEPTVETDARGRLHLVYAKRATAGRGSRTGPRTRAAACAAPTRRRPRARRGPT